MTQQLDYIFFFYGLGFILLGGICFTAEKKKNALPWTWLGLFGLIHGLNEWLDMLALDMFDSPLFKAVRICVMALSFICLVEFGRLGMISVHGKGPGRWVTLALFLVGCTGWLYNWVGLNVFFRYSIGFVGGIWSAYAILSARRRSDNPVERRNMLALGLFLVTYAVASGIIVPKAPFLPASLINHDSFLHRFGFPVQLLRGMLAVASAYCVWRVLEQRTLRTFRIVFVFSLLAILTGGWFYTNRQGKNEHSEWMDSLQSTCTISAAFISSDLVNGIDSIEDLQNPRYKLLKKRLMEMQRTSPEFRYIYLMVVRDGKIIFSADSEPTTSKDYSPPGDEYTDAPAELRALCRGKGRSATAEYEDQWGKWDSAFETVKDDATGKPVAILGMDYPQEKVLHAVNHVRLDAILATLLLAVVTILSFYFRERREDFIRSISEASKTLQQKEEDLSLTLRSIGDAVISTDAQGRVIRMNPTAEELTGWVHSEAVGHPISEVLNIVNALTGEPALLPVNEVLSTGEVYHLEDHTTLISRDGSHRQITDSSAPIRDVSGTIVGMVLVFSDMTEQYRIREHLQKNEAQLRAFMDNAGAAVYMKDTEGRYIHVNRVFEGLFDVKNAAIQGKTDYDLFPLEIAEAFVKNDRLILQVGLLQEIEEKVIANGRTYTYLSAKFPLKTANGEIYAICGISTDITERKQAEEALQKSEEKYRNLIETTRTGFLVLDGQGLVVDANAEYVRLSGHCELDEILGRCPIEWTAAHSLEKNSAALDQCFRERYIQGLEIDYTLVDGQITPIEINATVVGAGADLRIISLCRDITERKQAEKALSEALDRLLKISNQVPGLVYQFRLRPDGSSCMPFASNALNEIFRISPDEVREDASKVFACIHPDDYASVVASIQESAQDLTLWHPEFRVKYDDGTVRWLYGNAVPQMEEDGSVLWHGFVTDITERKQVEKALLESEEKHRHLIENSHDIIYTLTAEGIFNFVSPAWTALLGYPANQVEGKPFQQFIHPDDLAECMVFLQAVIETGERHKGVEYRVQHSDGSWRWHTTSAVPTSNEFGKIIGFEGTARDITDRKQAEDALKESEANFRTFFDSITDMIFVGTSDGQILYTNDACTRTLGYSAEELADMNVLDVHPSDKRQEAEDILGAMFRGERESCPLSLAAKNGVLVPVDTRVWFGRWNGADCIFGISKNLTAEQEAQQRFERLFRNNPALMALSTLPDRRFADANDTFLNMLGYSHKEIVGKTADELNLFPDLEQQTALADKLIAEGTIADFELQVQRKDGAILYGLFSGEVINNQGQQHFLTVMIDITERKRSMNVLRESEDKFSKAFHGNPDAVLITRLSDGRVVDVNDEFTKLTGFEKNEALSISTLALELWAEPGDRECCTAALQRDGSVSGIEFGFRVKSGDIIQCLYTGSIIDIEGVPHVLSMVHDITERKQAEDALKESEARWQFALSGSGDGVWDWNTLTNRVFFSPQWKSMFGYTQSEIGDTLDEWDSRVHPDDKKQCFEDLDKHFRGETPVYQNEHRVLCKDGSYKWILDRGKVVEWTEDNKPHRVIGTHTDITERILAEKTLEEIAERLSLATRASGVGVWDYDVVNNVLHWDNQMYNLYGITPETFGGEYESWQAGVHPEDMAQGDAETQMALRGEKEFDTEFRVLWSDGSIRNIRAQAIVQRDVSGQPLHMIGTNWDITESKQAEEALRESEETFRSYIENSFDIIFTLDITGKFLFLSPAWERHFGYPVNDFIGKMFVPFVHPDDCKHLGEYLMRVFETGESETSLPYRVKHSNGDWHWFIANGTLYTNKNGELQFIGVGRDITVQKHGDELLQREKDNLSAIFASSPVGMLLLDEETMIVNANDVVSGMISRSLEHIVGQRGGGGLGCVHSFENEKGCGFSSVCGQCSLRQGVTQVLKTGTSIRGAEIQVSLINNGQEQSPWLRVNAEPVTINGRKHVIIAFDDITDRKQAEEELIQSKAMTESLNRQLNDAIFSANSNAVEAEIAKDLLEDNADELKHQATHDSLTGLPNRHYFEEHLGELIKSGSRKKSGSMAVLFLDLDKFKLVNDTLGHKVGDLLLIEVSHRLQSCLRSEDILARMGGDEFTIILTNSPRKSSVDKLATRMIDMISRPYDIQGHRFMIGVSIGIASYPSDGTDTVTLLKHADAAMYKAKQAGRGLFSWFTGEVDVDNQQRAVLENDIRLALENNQFDMHYQPIVSLEDNRLLSAEALLRWKHPEKGMIAPSLFIPLAEEMGLIGKIGDYALQTACAQTVAWRDEGIHLSRINVNVSTKQINNDKWLESVIATLSKTGLDPKLLNLEVTETDFTTDDKEMMETLHKVRELGISMAIDDFGMGRSSLSRLKDFPVIHLKIDGSFIRDIEHNKDDNALVRSIVDMAHNQGIKVTAEWVESKTQMEILRSSGCDFIQGYYISPALSAQDFKDFAHEWMHNHSETKTA